jgi:hypothetical protein
MIIDYHHKQGGHCESATTTNLLNHHGLKITEPMVLGISGSLFFAYIPLVKLQFAPLFTYRSMPGLIFSRANNNLGVTIKREKFKNPVDSMNALDAQLSQGNPVGLQVGAYHLPFFPPEYRMHYNMHNMVIYGKEGDEYLVSDTVLPEPQRISYNDLLKVRYPKGPFSPSGKMYYPTHVPEEIDVKAAAIKGLKKTIYEMTEIPMWFLGTKGIRHLSKKLAKWPEKLGEKTANYYLGQLLRMQEEVGTGGAGFRFMFAAFLSEFGEQLNNSQLIEYSKKMGETANLWRHFSILGAKNCKYRGGVETSYFELSKILAELADREENIFKQLKKVPLN